MTSPRSHTINAIKPTHLRVGIKWDPLERDKIKESHALGHANEVRKELAFTLRQIKTQQSIIKLLRLTFFFRTKDMKFERLRDQYLARKKALEKFLAQENVNSYDLDLCGFCYDRDGKLVKFVSPESTETRNTMQKQMAFMHSGDDNTGTGEIFDEELLINLYALDEAIHQVFFVVVSINHGFDQIKGGFWSIVHTAGEKELLSATLCTQLQHRVHVMAKLSRNGESWLLDQIADYCSLGKDENIPLHLKMDQ
jgi:stress response protein SCP2